MNLYEEKYNEILEWARKNKARLNGVPIEEVLPELAESEDERIRRTLVEYFGPEVQLDFVRGVPIKKIRDWLEKQKEQKPAEWGEDDEFSKILNLVYKAIRKVLANFRVYSEDEELLDSREESIDYYSQRCAEEILKSLRPSWKPSEEQMKALLNTLHPDDPYYHDLKSLYEQLKKLM